MGALGSLEWTRLLEVRYCYLMYLQCVGRFQRRGSPRSGNLHVINEVQVAFGTRPPYHGRIIGRLSSYESLTTSETGLSQP